ncbi:uncharacterized protein E0L32_009267 [Thyridium curvatum]|uniref:Cystinosin n=1 Tax=Thyridium curvatum TaxID=1093900 RepID=A0A507ASM6_9PEZI|nr:uncharacterized protein E0L32_009267 [Thyridium curvatum]TPX09524.1 hypothetical protein E0L32_009267 [Thyridium curvatum]
MSFLTVISAIFGWIYTICWSLSFYPQPVLNYRRGTTSGTTVDFPFINTLGFIAYFVSNCALFYSPVIRAQYAARHHGLPPAVQFNDVVFAGHALILCIIIVSQYLPGLWGFAPALGRRPSRFILGVALGCVTGVLGVIFLVAGAQDTSSAPPGSDPAATGWAWLDAVYAISYVKLIITVIKYTPQILTNYRNKSTQGWSIVQILLDFSGGVLSIAQLGIDSYLQGDWSGVTGNPVKFALGNVSMFYDVIFILQHYVLYPDAESKARETDRLLERGESGGRLSYD